MASKSLQELQDKLQSIQYTPKTDEQIKAQAEGEYKSYYDQLRLAAQQQKDASDLALQQRREGLKATYDKQREQSARDYASAYSSADRLALSRGMQRSSYNSQTLANINTKSAEAQQSISDQQAAAEGDIDEQRTLLAQQLAQQLSQYTASQAADVLNRIRELEDQEYQRATEAQQYNNSLVQQIYQLIYQEQRDTIADQQWEREFEENVRQFNASVSGSSSSGGSGASKKNTPTTSAGAQTSAYDNLLDALGGGQPHLMSPLRTPLPTKAPTRSPLPKSPNSSATKKIQEIMKRGL